MRGLSVAARIVLAVAGAAGTVFFAFCAWALYGPFPDVAMAAAGAALISLAVCLWAAIRRKPSPEQEPSPVSSDAGSDPPPQEAAPVSIPDGPRFSGTFAHVSGLGIPAGAKCRISYWDSALHISALNHDFTLPHEKVRSASLLTRKEVQRQYVSSAGGAVAGAMLLGPLGAAVGGGVRRRSVRSRDRFLIFGYDGGQPNETRFLVFHLTQWGDRGHRFVSAYKKRLDGAVTQIDL